MRVLSLLLEVSSVTRAAQILDTTQSSVSKILAKLRVHFGDPLFVRVGLSLRPTPKAIELAQPLRGLLTASDAMRSSTSSFDPGSSTREFSVLVTEVGEIDSARYPLSPRVQTLPGILVVYAKKPFGGPQAVLTYLSRYTHRVAIANRRLIAADEAGVPP